MRTTFFISGHTGPGLIWILLIGSIWYCGTAFPQTPETESAVRTLYEEAQVAKGRGDLAGAIEKYRAILKLNPRLAAAYNNLGLLQFEQQNYPEAVKAFVDGLRLDRSMSSSLVLLGVAYYQIGQFDKARPALEEAVGLNPSDEQAQFYLGHSLFNLGEQEAGVAILQKLVQKFPKNSNALYSLGQMYMKLAQATLKKLGEQAPDSYLAYLIKGQVLEGMENYEGALVEYKKAAARQPNFRGVHYNLGNIYWLQGKWSEALAELKQEIAFDPYNCLAQWKVGNILMKTNSDPAQSLSYVQRALEICPDLPQAILDYGRLLANKREDEKAIEQFKRVIQISPEEASVHYLLGNLYRILGRLEDSKVELGIFQQMQEKSRLTRELQAGEVQRRSDWEP